MKIKRVVNGVEMEFELTCLEIEMAYKEQKISYTVEDIQERLSDRDDVLLTDDELEEIANDAQDLLANDDVYYDCYWQAINDSINQFLKEEK